MFCIFQWRRRACLILCASAIARRNERENSRAGKKLQKIRRTQRTYHIEHRQPAFCAEGLPFSGNVSVVGKTEFRRCIEPLDFVADPAAATQRINKWVADQTRDRIRDLIPGGALDKTTRLVLANALYLKTPWAGEFSQSATQSEPFFVRGAPAMFR